MKPLKMRLRLDLDNTRILDMKESMRDEESLDEAFRTIKTKLFGK